MGGGIIDEVLGAGGGVGGPDGGGGIIVGRCEIVCSTPACISVGCAGGVAKTSGCV